MKFQEFLPYFCSKVHRPVLAILWWAGCSLELTVKLSVPLTSRPMERKLRGEGVDIHFLSSAYFDILFEILSWLHSADTRGLVSWDEKDDVTIEDGPLVILPGSQCSGSLLLTPDPAVVPTWPSKLYSVGFRDVQEGSAVKAVGRESLVKHGSWFRRWVQLKKTSIQGCWFRIPASGSRATSAKFRIMKSWWSTVNYGDGPHRTGSSYPIHLSNSMFPIQPEGTCSFPCAQLQDPTSPRSVWFVVPQCLLFSSLLFLFSTFLLCSCRKGSSARWELPPGRFRVSAAMPLRPEVPHSRMYRCSHRRQEVRICLAGEVAVTAHNEF